MSERDVESMSQDLDRYHRYLEKNYEGGSSRVFSPTGFLKTFQVGVSVKAAKVRDRVYAGSMDEATAALTPLVSGGEGVYDLQAAAGLGKTSVFPFKFPSSRVVVALPTSFDAWSAYTMATGSAKLRLEGLSLGPDSARVTYVDSYLAAKAMLSNYLEYDILIVDECDSPRGVTRFLAEVGVPGKVVIRMSATMSKKDPLLNKSFQVTEHSDMPDVRKSPSDLAAYVGKHHGRRSLVLAPDSEAAEAIASSLPNSSLITTKSNLGDIARVVMRQTGSCLIVSDDACARGLNLNVDALFDCQLVSEFNIVRNVTPQELTQRRGRVGRNKPGHYYSPNLGFADKPDHDMDTVRHNVVRSISDVQQVGDSRLRLSKAEGQLLMCSTVEPSEALTTIRREQSASPEHARVGSTSSSSADESNVAAGKIRERNEKQVRLPSWLAYMSGAANSGEGQVRKSSRGLLSHRSSSSSGSSGELVSYGPAGRAGSSALGADTVVLPRGVARRGSFAAVTRALPKAAGAPYASSYMGAPTVRHQPVDVPMSPPIMNLTEMQYDLDWPELVADRLRTGGDLPVIIPTHSWRHTSASGIGSNWLQRLDSLAVSHEFTFTDEEFELVVRAWNVMAKSRWVQASPGLSLNSNLHRLEFCARYYQVFYKGSSSGS